ncbi:DNA-binding transcriptional regulator, HxlR family [Actinokineospora alba]|uniref:DNA-binding transcriptional regulator, HxlR family n=1 Tax=Actinokineospora alba TaxID=504798 RepID=A0A1H0FX14_9PSEU|nr:helix-turn-helix domain-containing protein [Actinokineospora alba]TDP69663.1 HxlR family transcriptional regulator [Actinokineospora alba]SDI11740.1 DNA-binding transcriptional regulator, HxlR family [Actinokineospora alba]SDN99228.1 DNA-binding transcriptional regulator, HxlR family [Actinokineospora alba]
MTADLTDTRDGARLPGPKSRVPDCPLGRAVETIGHWWTLEIAHEVFDGHTRFTAIQRNLTTAPDVLRERLGDLVAKGLLEVVDTGADDTEYRLTDLGRALRPVLLVMAAFGNHRLAEQDRAVVLVDAESGAPVNPVVVDQVTGAPVDAPGFVFAQGPLAGEVIRARYPRIPRLG